MNLHGTKPLDFVQGWPSWVIWTLRTLGIILPIVPVVIAHIVSHKAPRREVGDHRLGFQDFNIMGLFGFSLYPIFCFPMIMVFRTHYKRARSFFKHPNEVSDVYSYIDSIDSCILDFQPFLTKIQRRDAQYGIPDPKKIEVAKEKDKKIRHCVREDAIFYISGAPNTRCHSFRRRDTAFYISLCISVTSSAFQLMFFVVLVPKMEVQYKVPIYIALAVFQAYVYAVALKKSPEIALRWTVGKILRSVRKKLRGDDDEGQELRTDNWIAAFLAKRSDSTGEGQVSEKGTATETV